MYRFRKALVESLNRARGEKRRERVDVMYLHTRLIGAVLYYGKNRGGLYGQAIYRQVGSWAIGLFIFGLLVPGINNWGHIGGGIAGALLGALLGYQEKRRESQIQRLLAVLCVSLTIAVLGYAVVTALLYRFLG